jgi:hypothetical protein
MEYGIIMLATTARTGSKKSTAIIMTRAKFKILLSRAMGLFFRKLRNQEGKRLIGSLSNNGYVLVKVGDKMIQAHRLVYELFSGSAIPKTNDANRPLVIAHRDDNKINNAFDNLQLITQSQNSKDAYQTGVGIRAPRIARAVVATNATTGETTQYQSMNKAAIALNITRRSILRTCNGIYHSATSKSTGVKYSFRFAE